MNRHNMEPFGYDYYGGEFGPGYGPDYGYGRESRRTGKLKDKPYFLDKR